MALKHNFMRIFVKEKVPAASRPGHIIPPFHMPFKWGWQNATPFFPSCLFLRKYRIIMMNREGDGLIP